MMVITETRHAY